jgi:hypothetical protein
MSTSLSSLCLFLPLNGEGGGRGESPLCLETGSQIIEIKERRKLNKSSQIEITDVS